MEGTSNAAAGGGNESNIETVNPCMEWAVKTVDLLITILSVMLALYLIFIKTYNCESILHLGPFQGGIIAVAFVIFITSFIIYLRERCLIFYVLGFLLALGLLAAMITLGLHLTGTVTNLSIPASPTWLSSKVNDENHWQNIKACIYNRRECDDLSSKLSPIKSGCCIPPAVTCNKVDVINGTLWGKNDTAACVTKECDCYKWQTECSILCYDCFSCKQGFLKELRDKWVRLGWLLILISAPLFVCHLLSFAALLWDHHNERLT